MYRGVSSRRHISRRYRRPHSRPVQRHPGSRQRKVRHRPTTYRRSVRSRPDRCLTDLMEAVMRTSRVRIGQITAALLAVVAMLGAIVGNGAGPANAGEEPAHEPPGGILNHNQVLL